MTRTKLSVSKILANNKSALVLSFLLAVIIWIVVTMQFSAPQEVTLQEIPVTIDTTMPDNLELQIFGQTQYTVNVKVSGKRYEVSSAALSADDFQVTASAANVSSAGKATLPLNVRLKDTRSDVKIISFSPESIEVYFDLNLTQNYPVEVQVTPEDMDVAASGYVAGDILPSVATVTVTGAANEMQKISKVVAKVKLTEPLTQTTKFENTPLDIVNSIGGAIRSTYVHVEEGISDVTVTVPILKVMNLTPSLRFKNQPSYFVEHPISLAWYPSGTVKAAVSTELLESTDSLALGTIDFANISMGINSFTFNANDIPNIRILDESIESFSVRFMIDGFESKTFKVTADAISFNNLPTDRNASIPEDTELEVTVIGSRAELETLTSANILATVDLTGIQTAGGTETLPVNCVVENTTTCWVSGTHPIAVTVS